MSHRNRTGRLASLLLLAFAAVLGATACKGLPSATALKPAVAPPAIQQAGTLRAGVDLSTPPFGGSDGGKQAGIDIDVAAALASKLGLKLVVVDVKPADAASALASGTVDVVMSVPYSAEALARTSLAGSYITDGPAFFVATDSTTSVEPSMTLDTLTTTKIGAQERSPAYWKLASELGSDTVTTFSTLRGALTALQSGAVDVVAGDALVGAYIIRDMPTVHFAGQLEPAVPVGVAVSTENSTLADAVRRALDGLAGDGVLDTVRTKWVGSLPALQVPASVDASGSSVASATP